MYAHVYIHVDTCPYAFQCTCLYTCQWSMYTSVHMSMRRGHHHRRHVVPFQTHCCYYSLRVDVVVDYPRLITTARRRCCHGLSKMGWHTIRAAHVNSVFIDQRGGHCSQCHCQVITAASPANTALLKSLGADVVVDYHQHPIFDILENNTVDVVYDNYGSPGTADKAMPCLKPGGTHTSTRTCAWTAARTCLCACLYTCALHMYVACGDRHVCIPPWQGRQAL